jgi:hypothetical protein
MNVQILPLQRAAGLRERLERDGWKCRRQKNGALVASHARVATETDARRHLYRLGLLTSRGCRIYFSPHPLCRPRRPQGDDMHGLSGRRGDR